MTTLSPASQKLLREIARRDKGHGVAVRYAGRGRWHLDGSCNDYNRGTFPPLFEADLVVGWDEHDDDGPLSITDAGRKLAGELDAEAAAQQAAKKARPKPSAEGAAAQRLLREIAKRSESTLIYSDSRGRRTWSLGSHDGYRASADTWLALSGADLIHIEYGFAGGRRVSVTDAGRKRLAAGR
ncbi:hypothetical protein ACFYVK_35145 [Streptomyces chartreusis]|uniref:hypothetical protein n=1 Tax=Streptomyces chartreusis TaxID=1969 RepID=UPI00369CFBFD